MFYMFGCVWQPSINEHDDDDDDDDDVYCTTSSVSNSVDTDPNLTKFSHNVQKWLLINLQKSKLWFYNLFPNARWQMNDDRQIAAQFAISLGLLGQSWANLHSSLCRENISIEYFWIEIAIIESVSKCQCWIKVISQILPKISCHGNVPWGIRKEVRIKQIHANTFHIVKRSWKSAQKMLRYIRSI